MLIYLQATVIIVLLSCLASAYSTLFLTEGVGEEGKTPIAEVTKIQRTEKNHAIKEQVKNLGIEVEVIPIVTDVFTQPEDMFNITPIKLVAAISAQHLITTVSNIPIAGNSYIDSLAMLEDIVSEFNKTAQIIKLTAKYVNISGHYILSILKEFSEQSCDVKSLNEDMKSVRKKFLKTITDHATGAIKELNEKTRNREMTGSDILVSSSYHIVSAFQEMTNQVLHLAEENKNKCKASLPNADIPPLSGDKKSSEQKGHDVLTFQLIPQQGKKQKSIKKDQAQLKPYEKNAQTTSRLFQELQNSNQDDLTIKTYLPKTILNTNNDRLPYKKDQLNQLKLPENTPVKYIPLNKISLFKNSKNGISTKSSETGLYNKKISPIKKLVNFQDQTVQDSNDQDLTVEVFSPENISKANNNQLLSQTDLINKIKSPTELKYIPLNKISLLKNSKSGILTEAYREDYGNQKPPTINKFENSQNQTPKNLNNQNLRVNSFSLEGTEANNAQISNQKGEEDQFKISDDLTVEYPPPHSKLSLLNPKNGKLIETSKEDQTTLKILTKSNMYDRELDSMAVDSLSNVPWSSNESENKGLLIKTPTENQLYPKTEMNIVDLLQRPYQNEQKQKQCDENLEPVCCFDKNNKNFIIFLNDCKREEHNSIYKSSYSPVQMDTCVGLFLRNPTLFAQHFGHRETPVKNVDLRPR